MSTTDLNEDEMYFAKTSSVFQQMEGVTLELCWKQLSIGLLTGYFSCISVSVCEKKILKGALNNIESIIKATQYTVFRYQSSSELLYTECPMGVLEGLCPLLKTNVKVMVYIHTDTILIFVRMVKFFALLKTEYPIWWLIKSFFGTLASPG